MACQCEVQRCASASNNVNIRQFRAKTSHYIDPSFHRSNVEKSFISISNQWVHVRIGRYAREVQERGHQVTSSDSRRVLEQPLEQLRRSNAARGREVR